MRHKYATEALVLSRTSLGEASALVTLLTKELGLVRARAQGVRKPAAKLASALQTFMGTDVVLVRGKEGWRLTGAMLSLDHFAALTPANREHAGRIAGLMQRMLTGEHADPEAYTIFAGLLAALSGLEAEEADAAETLAALYLLRLVGVDAGDDVPDIDGPYGQTARAYALANRTQLIVRINHGIEASGL